MPRATVAAFAIAAAMLRHEARPRVVGILLAGRQRRIEALDDRRRLAQGLHFSTLLTSFETLTSTCSVPAASAAQMRLTTAGVWRKPGRFSRCTHHCHARIRHAGVTGALHTLTQPDAKSSTCRPSMLRARDSATYACAGHLKMFMGLTRSCSVQKDHKYGTKPSTVLTITLRAAQPHTCQMSWQCAGPMDLPVPQRTCRAAIRAPGPVSAPGTCGSARNRRVRVNLLL